MDTLVRISIKYIERGLSINFPLLFLLGEDEDGPYTEPLIDITHFELLTNSRCVYRSEITKIYHACYEAVKT